MASIYLAIGHGVSTDGTWDSGCVYGNDTEAALMQPIVGAAVQVLQAHGVNVYTDYPDNDMNCTYTIASANAAGVDAYMSCHCDYDRAPSGTYPIIYPGSASGSRLANAVNASVMSRMGLGTRGVLQRDDMEVANTNMTACIFETGSINADNATLHNSAAYGQAIAFGILDYFGIAYDGSASAPAAAASASAAPAASSGESLCLQYGDEGAEVQQLQRDLRTMAYEDENGNALKEDGDFGGSTEYAVKRLQRCHGIEEDGIYGPDSDGALMSDVKEVQEALKKHGYNLDVDGAVGEETQRCLRDLEYRSGIDQDLIAGNLVRKILGI